MPITVTITSQKIPKSFDEYRIVQLSDFPIGTYHDYPATVEKIVEKVISLYPDVIVFTGDLVNSYSEEIEELKIGNWSPSVWTYPEWGGIYRNGSQLLYVSTGIGENIAFRFGAWPQIVMITLRSCVPPNPETKSLYTKK